MSLFLTYQLTKQILAHKNEIIKTLCNKILHEIINKSDMYLQKKRTASAHYS